MKKHPMFDFVQTLCLLVAFYFFGNGELTNTKSNAIYYFPYCLSLVSLAISLLIGEQKVSKTVWYRLAFMLVTIFSMTYAIHFDYSFIGVKGTALTSVVMFAVAFEVLNREHGWERIAKIYVASVFANDVVILTTVDLKELAELGERLGKESVGSAWNANSIGLSALFASALSFLLLQQTVTNTKKRKGLSLLLLTALSALFLYVIVLSGSRKALLGVVFLVGVGLFCVMKAPFVVKTAAVCILSAIAFWALYRIPFLYSAVGYRFDSFFAFFGIGNAIADKSVSTRSGMIEFGLRIFPNRPFLGNGINCYQVLYGAESGWVVYAHNNYIELLVDLGLIGTAVYYLFPARFLFKKVSSRNARFFRAFLFLLFVMDFAMVSHSEPTAQTMLTVCLCMIEKSSRKRTPCANTADLEGVA